MFACLSARLLIVVVRCNLPGRPGPDPPNATIERDGTQSFVDETPRNSTPCSTDSRWYAWVSGFTAVKFIDLESVTYADGTSWHASNGKPCRILVGSSI